MNENRTERTAEGKRAGLLGLCLNAALFVGKTVVGVLSGSVSVAADAVNNLSDAASSVVTLIGFRLAEKPADADHPYGHARYEYLSGLAVAGLILIIGFELARASVGKLLHPTPVAVTPVLTVTLLVSIAVKLGMAIYYRKIGRRINSATLFAAAADSRNDVISTAAVLVAALIEGLFDLRVDGMMGLAVALFIFWSGTDIARQTISPLLGENASPELRQAIIQEMESSPLVLGCHDLMVHDYGPGQRFASIHVEMDRREDPLRCHEAIDSIERRCLEDLGVHLVIHYDPVAVDDPRRDRLRSRVETLLRELGNFALHDFRVAGDTLYFDVVLPFDALPRQEQIRQRLEQGLLETEGKPYTLVITFDPVG